MNIAGQKPIATLEFESFTPLWPGGPLNGKTYHCVPQACIGPFLPDSKQLVGRARWLLRAVEASISILLGKPVRGYGDVDNANNLLYGSTQYASKLRVVVSYDQASIQGKNYISLNDARTLERIYGRSGINKLGNFIQSIEIDGFILIRERLNLPSTPMLTRAPKVRRSFEMYLKASNKGANIQNNIKLLFTIPRFRIAVQGIRRLVELYEKQPLRPGIRLRVEVYGRHGYSLSTAEACVAIESIVFTAAFLGLGKAASRGFGRFELVDFSVDSSGLGEVEAVLEKLKSMGSAEGMKQAFLELGLKLLECTARLLNKPLGDIERKLDVTNDEEIVRKTRVPLFVTALNRVRSGKGVIDSLKHPCPYATPELASIPVSGGNGCINGRRAVHRILEALSAVGKATLKSTWKIMYVNVTDAGIAFHTWPLGLPRSARNTGYYIATRPFSGEECSARTRRLDASRRLSVVFFTVNCSSGNCFGLVEPFLSYQDFQTVSSRLVHVGKHYNIYHVVNVAYAALRDRLGHRGCPPDPAGVAGPSRGKPGTAASDPILDPIMESVEWIERLLR